MKSFILLIVSFFLFITCKNSSLSKNADVSKEIQTKSTETNDKIGFDTALENKKSLLKYDTNFIIPKKIPTPKKLEKLLSLKILKTEIIDFNGDGKLDFLCKVEKDISNGKMIEEYWITSDEKILRKKELSLEYDYKWFINLDDDKELELIKAQGESEGISYGVYNLDFSLQNDSVLFYFNPIIEKENKYYWGYPWEIKDILCEVKDQKKVKISLNHNIERDGVILRLGKQKKLPVLVFTGETQKEFEIKNITSFQFIEIEKLMKNLFN